MRVARITTTDNPYDPFDDFDKWYLFDESRGYGTTGYLGRVVKTSNELSDADNQEAIEVAIDSIIDLHPTGIYRKIVRNVVEEFVA